MVETFVGFPETFFACFIESDAGIGITVNDFFQKAVFCGADKFELNNWLQLLKL